MVQVTIIILIINNCEPGHDICHDHHLGHHHHHHHHYHSQYWMDPIETRLLNSNSWHHIQTLKSVQPKLSHSCPVPSLFTLSVTFYKSHSKSNSLSHTLSITISHYHSFTFLLPLSLVSKLINLPTYISFSLPQPHCLLWSVSWTYTFHISKSPNLSSTC